MNNPVDSGANSQGVLDPSLRMEEEVEFTPVWLEISRKLSIEKTAINANSAPNR